MKILLVHADFIEYEAKKKAIQTAEDLEKPGPVRVNEALVVFCSVEKRDEKVKDKIISNTVKEILDVYGQVKAKNIVIYPFVHLSHEPSSPAAGLSVVKGVEKKVLEKKVKVKRAPFGWYKAFDIKCKGHPLAELSRDITAEGGKELGEEEVPEALKKEKELKSAWFVVDTKCKFHKISMKDDKITGFDFRKHPKLEKLTRHEMAKSRDVKEEPPHIKIMRKLELVDYEEGSDPGHFRYFPKGKMVKALLEDWVTKNMLEYGAMEVETPIMYDLEHPALKDYINRFPARQYSIDTPNKRVFLRFAACFGQFLMTHDASVSYRNLPLRLYEMTRYSFRVEQRGELAGLRRLRGFTMPDCHAVCKDIPQAKEEMMTRFDVARKIQNGIGLRTDDIELSIRTVKDFNKHHPDHVKEVVKRWGKPVLVEIWDQRFFYFVFKHEWNFVDALDKAACLTTDQIDVENAARYKLKYTDVDNTRKEPVILHLSPSGSIERVMYAIMEKYHMQQQAGRNPVFPLWLAPTQVRLCPVSEKFIKDVGKIAEQLEKQGIRVDVDDRTESVGKKIHDAETEWINMIAVIGDKELKSKKIAVRFRETGKVKGMSLKQIADLVRKETEGFPSRPLPLPKLLTKRPVFYG
ncbi:MAG: threonine--tRNA ligase [Candidatus Aenigmatarchaeota archaeon]|nr:MAG: threonine--tRNA ligase [Candidatus Aenigmarchaeota archaeon]